MPIPTQATRRIIESFQTGNVLKQITSAGKNPAVTGLPADTGNNYQAIQEFEAKINAPDYPQALREAYFVSKSQNNYTYFNDQVTKYNTNLAVQKDAATKKAEEFEAEVNKPDYPAELKKSYQEAKDKNDFTIFNKAVEAYNTHKRTEYEEQEKRYREYISSLESYKKPEVKPPSEAFQRALDNYMKFPTPENKQKLEQLDKDENTLIQVGRGSTPEYISKYDYDLIAAGDKANNTNFLEILHDSGLAGLNASVRNRNERQAGEYSDYKQERAAFEVQINSPEFPAELRASAKEGLRTGDFTKYNAGVDRYNASQSAEKARFERDYHIIDGQGILKTDWEKLSAQDQRFIEREGYNKYFEMQGMAAGKFAADDAYIEAQLKDMAAFKDKDGAYDLETYIRSKVMTADRSIADKFRDDNGDVDVFKYHEYLDKMAADNKKVFDYDAIKRKLIATGFDEEAVSDAVYYAKLSEPQKYWQGSTPWNEKKGETANVGQSLQMGAEFLIPFVYTGIHWKEMSTGGKIFNLAVDAISVVGAGARSANVAARGVAGTATRAGVMKAAAQGFAHGAASAIVPIDVILHPLGSAKASANELRNLAENLANPKKLPVMSVYTSEHTVRLSVRGTLSASEAMAVRDKLMQAVQRGERVFVELADGRTLELRRSSLMKELPGSFAHATPGGAVFEKGLKVEWIPSKRANEQGLFVAQDPVPGFTQGSAFGKSGEKPTIFILSKETANRTVSSNKIYNSPFGPVAEMERKLPVGDEVAEVGQKLYTRLADGTRVEIWLEKGVTLKPSQIAKLKAKGILESITAPFSNVMQFKGKGRSLEYGEVEILSNELRKAGARSEARNLMRAQEILMAQRAAATPRLVLRAGQEIRRGGGGLDRQDRRERVSARPNSIRSLSREEREQLRRRVEVRRVPGYINRVPFSRRGRRPDIENPERTRRLPDARGYEARRADIGRETRRARGEVRREENPLPERPRTAEPRAPREPVERYRYDAMPPRIPPGRTFPPSPPRTGLPGSKADKANRAIIASAGGAVAINMGEVGAKNNRKRVWDVVVKDYAGNENYYRVIGDPPKGATILQKGKGSAYATAQMLTGEPPKKPVTIDKGIMDIELKAEGKKITAHFKADPKQQTVGDIQAGTPHPISERFSQITGRMPRISGRSSRITGSSPRISSKMPRLR